MVSWLTIIQLLSGLGAAVTIFIGLYMSVKKLNPEDRSSEIPKDIVYKSTRLLVIGLLLYTVTKSLTLYSSAPSEDYFSCAGAALVSVLKTFGFIILIPFLLNYVRVSNYKKKTTDDQTKD